MIEELLTGKSARERANIKATELAKLNFVGEYVDPTYGVRVEIQELTKIEGGVQIFARAWKNGKQLGFGADGTVEIERFRIFNPPILVGDTNGDIVRAWTDDEGKVQTRKLREVPLGAIRKSLAHTIKLVGKENTLIVEGSIGNTVSTFYPDAGTGSTTVDGRVINNTAGETWASVRDGESSASADPTGENANCVRVEAGGSSNIYNSIAWGAFLFNTVTLPDTDTIDSAVLSLFGTAKANTFGTIDSAVHIAASSPAANNDLTGADYSERQRTSFASMTHAAWSTIAYNDFSLNASGLANISKIGVSKFSSQLGADINNTEPTWANSVICTTNCYYADRAGTTEDPKLVVTHTASSASSSPSSSISSSPSISVSSSPSSSASSSISSSPSSSISSSPSISISNSPSSSISPSSSLSDSPSSSISNSPSSSPSSSLSDSPSSSISNSPSSSPSSSLSPSPSSSISSSPSISVSSSLSSSPSISVSSSPSSSISSSPSISVSSSPSVSVSSSPSSSVSSSISASPSVSVSSSVSSSPSPSADQGIILGRNNNTDIIMGIRLLRH